MVFDTLLSHSRLLLAAAVIAVLLVSAPPPSAAQQPSQADVAQPYKFAALDPAPENTTDSSNISPVTNETPEKQSNRILGIFPNYRAVSADTQLPPLSLQKNFWLATQDSFENPSGQTKGARASEPSPAGEAQPPQKSLGTVSGRVVDQNGSALAGIDVQIQADQEFPIQEAQSDEDGRFDFDRVPPGPFQLTAMAQGFVTQTISNTLRPGEDYFVPPITMPLAMVVTEVRVSPSTDEIAQEQFKEQEQQRVLGIVPNFYVTYVGEAAPLSPKRKFELALKATTDPVTTVAVATIAGVGQATNRFSGYGQGAQGYAKRYGASYANFASGLWIGGAVLPSILKQDPRYFYNGSGTKLSRFLYAVSRPFICKGDNQRWQPNYSSVFGDLAAGGLSNLYIPERDRHGAQLTFENAGIALGTTAAINVLQEFVLRRLTSKRQ